MQEYIFDTHFATSSNIWLPVTLTDTDVNI